MSRFRSILCVATLIGLAVLAFAQADSGESATAELQRSLLGAWVLEKSEFADDPAVGVRMKFWGLNHWLITETDADTGEVRYHHGGTYTLDGDEYVETFTFANKNTTHMLGTKLRFTIDVKGDTYTQVGDDNSFTESWTRLKE